MDVKMLLDGFHFRNETWVLIIPLAMMAIDFFTGTMYAWSTSTFKSKKMRSGLTKKVGEISILVIGELFSYGMKLPAYIMPNNTGKHHSVDYDSNAPQTTNVTTPLGIEYASIPTAYYELEQFFRSFRIVA